MLIPEVAHHSSSHHDCTLKPEGPLQAVDTSSQASVKEVEVSLEGIPANICPIAAVSRSGSISPWVELNRAPD